MKIKRTYDMQIVEEGFLLEPSTGETGFAILCDGKKMIEVGSKATGKATPYTDGHSVNASDCAQVCLEFEDVKSEDGEYVLTLQSDWVQACWKQFEEWGC